jgi:hypothetical protein
MTHSLQFPHPFEIVRNRRVGVAFAVFLAAIVLKPAGASAGQSC